MSICSLTYQQSAIKATNISKRFTYKMAAKLNWRRYGTKLRHCHPLYTNRKANFMNNSPAQKVNTPTGHVADSEVNSSTTMVISPNE